MNNVTQIRPTIETILGGYFNDRRAGKAGIRRARIDGVEMRLRAYLELEGPRVLTDGQQVFLATAREFDPVDAFVRVMQAEDLAFALIGFVRQESLADLDDLDQLAQLRETEYLVAHLVRRRLIDGHDLSCPLLDLQFLLNSGRREIRLRGRART